MMGDFNPNVDPVSSHDTQIQGEISTKNPLPEIFNTDINIYSLCKAKSRSGLRETARQWKKDVRFRIQNLSHSAFFIARQYRILPLSPEKRHGS